MSHFKNMLLDNGLTDTILSELISILNCIVLYILVDVTHINKNSLGFSVFAEPLMQCLYVTYMMYLY